MCLHESCLCPPHVSNSLALYQPDVKLSSPPIAGAGQLVYQRLLAENSCMTQPETGFVRVVEVAGKLKQRSKTE